MALESGDITFGPRLLSPGAHFPRLLFPEVRCAPHRRTALPPVAFPDHKNDSVENRLVFRTALRLRYNVET